MRRNCSLDAAAVVLCAALAAAGCSGNGGASDPGGAADLATPDAGDLASADAPEVEGDAADAGARGDSPDATDTGSDDGGPPPVDPALRMREAGWMTGDLHSHSNVQGGEDPISTVVALSEYLQDPVFLAFHPEYAGNPIDFQALTDHRTVAGLADPAFASDRVVLIPGEEFGGPGHAGIWGLATHVPHDPGGDGSTRDDYAAAVVAAHEQGALFSMNHPQLTKIPFPWDVRDHDAMEVWNTRWGLQGMPMTPEDLAAWEARNGPASPFFKRAIDFRNDGGSGQFLRFYEAQLSLGIHVALVGGTDRHLLFPPGFPATWVQAPTRDVAGVLEGIRKRHTFVSRSPVSATVEMTVEVPAGAFAMGDEIPVAAEGVEATVTVRVGRGNPGRVRLVHGSRAADDAALATHPLGEAFFEAIVDAPDFTATATTTLRPGDWVYPVVHESIVAPGLDPALAAQIPAKVQGLSTYTEDNYAPVLEVLIDYIDIDVVAAPDLCDPAAWVRTDAQCLPADQTGMTTFFFPDWIDRLLNALTEDGTVGDWTMGAVGSAVLCVADAGS